MIHIYTPGWRGALWEPSVLPKLEHNTMSPARARTRTACSGNKRTDHWATAPPTVTYWFQIFTINRPDFQTFTNPNPAQAQSPLRSFTSKSEQNTLITNHSHWNPHKKASSSCSWRNGLWFKWRSALKINAMHSDEKWWIRSPFYIFFLNPVNIAARSSCLLCNS